jgi:hypothetical protein
MEQPNPIQIKLVYKKAQANLSQPYKIEKKDIRIGDNTAKQVLDTLIEDSGSIFAFKCQELSGIQTVGTYDAMYDSWDPKTAPIYLLEIDTKDGMPDWVDTTTQNLLGEQGEKVIIQYYYNSKKNNESNKFLKEWGEQVGVAIDGNKVLAEGVCAQQDLQDRKRKRANRRYWSAWVVAFGLRRLASWLNPANGIALAVFAIFIGAAWPAATWLLMKIAGIGLVFAAVTIVPFTIWEAVKHYRKWKYTNAGRPIEKSYGNYLLDLWNQLNNWGSEHFGQAIAVIFGVILAIAMLWVSVYFIFSQGGLPDTLLSLVFDAFKAVLAPWLSELSHLPGLSFLADIITPLGLNIIVTVLLTITPLVLVDLGRRIAQTRNEALQAGGTLVGGEGKGFDPWNPRESALGKYDMDLDMWREIEHKTTGPLFCGTPNYLDSDSDEEFSTNGCSNKK